MSDVKSREEIDDYLAQIRRTIAESESLMQSARLCLEETDQLLASQGWTREQVLNFKITDEQRREVDVELKRRGLPGLEELGCATDERVDYEGPDTQGDLDNRQRRFGDMMNAFRL